MHRHDEKRHAREEDEPRTPAKGDDTANSEAERTPAAPGSDERRTPPETGRH